MSRRGAGEGPVASGGRRPSATRRRARIAIAVGAVFAALALPVGWSITDALEADDDFCNACHLDDGTPLHIRLRRDFDARPPVSLAAAHGAASRDSHPADPAFRCIDCHGGVGLLGRARVKALAAKDAFWYVVGRFEEPEGMRWPLLDADCRRCHDGFRHKGDGLGGPAFHDLPVHNVELGVGCVECHLVHVVGGNADAWFLHGDHVRSRCIRCHPEFAGTTAGGHEAFQEGEG